MAIKGKSITILGAGIGGLTAAVALARRGARVTVMDQAEELGEVGAGIQISPNGVAVLDALGLGRRIENIGMPLEAVELRDYRQAREVMRLDLRARGYAHPYMLVHRADLIEMLAASAKRHGVSLIFDKKVTGIALGFDQVMLPLESGPQRSVKYLVGADGLRSLTRQALSAKRKPHFTGQIAWRATIEARFVPVHNMPKVATVYMGPKRHLVTYPLRGGSLVNVVAVEEREKWEPEDWQRQDDPANMQAAFDGWAPEVRRLLSVCDDVKIWGLFDHPVAETWSQSTAVILGDAVHPMLPFLAQGANMAIEDAWVLAEEWERHDDTQEAFKAYRKRREKRVRRVVKASAGNRRVYHMSNPVARFAAHTAMRTFGTFFAGRAIRRFDWLYGTDVTKEG